ncbi:RagB/SusD family nutrient uptake outer membrane protein [Bacteroides caccae]|uniref:RagB/SusD family nutrient uptake outer membrane protein n=1 Tax=Bacteroides caccae TaxID=47678 RepID=UPI00356A0F74
MSNIKYKIWMFLSLIAMTSCENILDKFPEDKITPETFFSTEKELELYSNCFYVDCFGGELFKDFGDVIIQPVLAQEVSGQRIIPETNTGFDGWGWGALRNINFCLENIHRCQNEEVRNHYEGLARFFRAYFYYVKVRRYGDVPWYDHVIGSDDTEDLSKPRDSREFVMQKVLEDINFAITNLRNKKDTYRVTRWTALALKSRICLFEGTFRKYHGLGDWEKYLNECASASDTFITESGYTVYTGGSTPYFGLFSSLNAQPTEIILAKDFNAALGLTNIVQAFCNSSGEANMGVTKRFVDSYLMKDGSRFTDKSDCETIGFAEEMKNRDPRLTQTIRAAGYIRDDGRKYLPDLGMAKLGYQLKKFDCGTKYDMTSEVDLPLFRTAEVYLNCAEAKAELGTLTSDDLNRTINKIRARVNMPDLVLETANANPDPYLMDWYPNVKSGVNQGVILEIRRERTIELVMEGFRYYDIMRWKEGKIFEKPFLGMYFPGLGEYDLDGDGANDIYLFSNVSVGGSSVSEQFELGSELNLVNGTSGNLIVHQSIRRVWNEDRDYFYPLPTKDRILTNGLLTQNPGWNDGLSF